MNRVDRVVTPDVPPSRGRAQSRGSACLSVQPNLSYRETSPFAMRPRLFGSLALPSLILRTAKGVPSLSGQGCSGTSPYHYRGNAVRPLKALSMVTSSALSRLNPAGRPWASRVTRTSIPANNWNR
jgi:hypothetical protein